VDAVEVWLRGPVPGIADILQPVAHALLQVREEMDRSLPSLDADVVWATPAGAASVAFHARHLAGSTDRLLTYALGAPLSSEQLVYLQAEGKVTIPAPDGDALLVEVRNAIDRAMEALRHWSDHVDALYEPRTVGRARLPSTVLGLLFHAAEHAQRHAGQVATTIRVLNGLADRRS
jgi:hypothetical protein